MPSVLFDAGWKRTSGGNWTHPNLPALGGRRRLLSEAQALTLQAASDELDQAPAAEPLPCADCGAFECEHAITRTG